MQPINTFTFYDCKSDLLRGSVRLDVFDSTYACYLYPHNSIARHLVKMEELKCLDDSDLSVFDSIKNHLANRIFN
jgi:hypothetical protein